MLIWTSFASLTRKNRFKWIFSNFSLFSTTANYRIGLPVQGRDTQHFHVSMTKPGLWSPHLGAPMVTFSPYTGRCVVVSVSLHIYTICHIVCNKRFQRIVTNVSNRTGKTATIRCIVLQNTGVSWNHGGQLGPSWNPSDITGLQYRGIQRGSSTGPPKCRKSWTSCTHREFFSIFYYINLKSDCI